MVSKEFIDGWQNYFTEIKKKTQVQTFNKIPSDYFQPEFFKNKYVKISIGKNIKLEGKINISKKESNEGYKLDEKLNEYKLQGENFEMKFLSNEIFNYTNTKNGLPSASTGFNNSYIRLEVIN